ncbi:Transmembrane protein 230 [Trichoplax sp. H2]|uniref:Transmembrane protein 230 n=1 Tax=Trichoplax adhaerens TaxID=10228 RepID=B3S393_TRIAD|nr:hypothetical protein TRIADDRAFT_58639 [Trichoplax adhaerens]EDV22749.1 hypothetical protein TRIADDRAFT_58639 [Trichoplax adhaerens]RDD40559.1 Transmembrane protein 230 [Trichoplax sp. H2]|eukprot:XP_002114615.1 hypothetical protein TRIADDRAFT_58639 [Trichoplax adhaerens]
MKKKASKYMRLQAEGNEEFTSMQFRKPKPRAPIKAIVLACTLFLAGSIMILMAALIFTGGAGIKEPDERRSTYTVLFVIGSLLFIPGFYHVRIAYYAYRGYSGYSYEDIPEFD